MTLNLTDPNAESFLAFTTHFWGKDWALVRGTARNKARYERCVSPKEMRDIKDRWDRTPNGMVQRLDYVGLTVADVRELLAWLDANDSAALRRELNGAGWLTQERNTR